MHTHNLMVNTRDGSENSYVGEAVAHKATNRATPNAQHHVWRIWKL
jgi:hypothetical protein